MYIVYTMYVYTLIYTRKIPYVWKVWSHMISFYRNNVPRECGDYTRTSVDRVTSYTVQWSLCREVICL